MKISELMENVPGAQLPIKNITYTPPKELGGTGKPLSLTPQQIQQLVKVNNLTYSPQAIKQVQQGRVEAPVVQNVAGKLQVVAGGDVLAALANSGQKVKVVVQPPQAPAPAVRTVPGQQAAAKPVAKQPGKIAQAAGAVASAKDKWNQGAMAANRVAGAISGIAGAVDRFSGK